jgi:hypothetical protein
MLRMPALFSVDTGLLFEFGTAHLAAKASRALLLTRIAPQPSEPGEP